MFFNEVVLKFVAYLCSADWLAYPNYKKLDSTHNLNKYRTL